MPNSKFKVQSSKIRWISKLLILAAFSIFVTYIAKPTIIYADELSDVEKKLSELTKALEQSKSATSNLVVTHAKLQAQLADIQNRIKAVESEFTKKEQEIKEGEELLGEQQDLLEERVREFYKRSYSLSPLIALLSSKGLGAATYELAYQRYITDEDKRIITAVVTYIRDLEEKKTTLQSEKDRLAVVREESNKQATFLKGEIAGAQAYQKKLTSEIASVTARQQQLIAAKLSSLNLPTSLGSGPLFCTDDRKLDPGFRPAFALFTFGIPHRVGLNQYGAYGRAKDGQNYQDILRAYFDGVNFEKKDSHMKIKVQGYGEKELDEYLLGIYEMPGDWPLEALKAQVVAARSYALNYTDNGAKEICTTQSCQVYKGGNKGGNWEQAVKQTEGEVLTRDGQVITAWYASTFGGYSLTSAEVGWNSRPWTKHIRDTKGDVGSFSELFERAYDKDSPCFYAAQGYRAEYSKSAWLKSEELADIVNALLLGKADSSTQNHLSQPDKPNPDGVETWSKEKLRDELRSRNISAYSSISDITMDWDKGAGRTTSVTISGDGGTQTFSADEFRNFFNVRAPANIQIVGPLFNAEKK